MPVGWLTMGTPPELQRLLDAKDYTGFAAAVDELVAAAGGVTIKILHENAGSPAHVLVAVPEKDAEAIFAELGNRFQTDVTKLYNVHEMGRSGGNSAA
jgi:hypothetical protein